jgi:hypothetical protein
VSLSLSATCNISKYSLAFIFVISPFPLVCIKLMIIRTGVHPDKLEFVSLLYLP